MDSQWLKVQFEYNPERTKAGLAKALGLEPSAVSKILKGTRQIKAHEYMLMRQYFGLPVDGENSLNKKTDSYVLEPLQNEETLMDGDPEKDDSEWIIPAEIIKKRTKAPTDQIKIFQVQETILEPEFRHGEYVVVDLSDQKPSPPGVFIVSDGFGHMMRFCEYVPKSSPPEIRISAHSTGFIPQILKLDEFTIIGRVIGRLQWL